MYIIAIAAAFERNAESGGGFRAVALDKRGPVNVRHEGDVHATLQEARCQARRMVAAFLGEGYKATRPADIYKNDERTCNYWID